MYLIAVDIIKCIRFHIQTNDEPPLVVGWNPASSSELFVGDRRGSSESLVVLQAGNVIDIHSHATIGKRKSERHYCVSGQ